MCTEKLCLKRGAEGENLSKETGVFFLVKDKGCVPGLSEEIIVKRGVKLFNLKLERNSLDYMS